MQELTLASPSERCTFALARAIGERLEPGDLLALWGELGAGKTFFAGGIARGLGIPEDIPIVSPTFTFINEYEGRLHLYHLDLYRLADFDELETLPWREALFGSGVAVVEWPERLGSALPDERWDIRLTITGDTSRTFHLVAHGARAQERLARWATELVSTAAPSH